MEPLLRDNRRTIGAFEVVDFVDERQIEGLRKQIDVDVIESDATRGGCGRGEFLEFVGERLYIRTHQTDELTEHLIVSRNFQLFQPRLGPRLGFRIL